MISPLTSPEVRRYVIGVPGQPPRLFIDNDDMQFVKQQVGPGEVVIEIAARGELVLSADGTRALPLQRTPEQLVAQQALAFADARRAAYPAIVDQLDQIFHDGLDAWRETIATIKAANPKPE